MNRKRAFAVLRLLSMLCLVAVLVGCGQPSTPIPTAPPPPPNTPPPPDLNTSSLTYVCFPGEKPAIEIASNNEFIDHEVELIGTEDALELVASQEGLELIEVCPLGHLPPLHERFMGLYLIRDPNPENPLDPPDPAKPERHPEALRDAINSNPQYQGMEVEAELNYLVGAPSTCADPHSGGGSAFGGLNPDASADQLLTQWSLNTMGFAYQAPTTPNDIPVFVLDTVPASLRPDQTGMDHEMYSTRAWPNADNDDPYFSLWTYDLLGDTPVEPGSGEDLDFSEHGFTVASAVRSVSSNSSLHLVRILNENGCAHTHKLASSIPPITEALQDSEKIRSVINMSLTLRTDDDPNLPHLKVVLRAANAVGAVIVAAAGNNSAELPEPADIGFPARFTGSDDEPYVVGVAASDPNGIRSCYSNKGDIAAPAGTGGPDGAGNDCALRINSWSADPIPCDSEHGMGQCGYGVINLTSEGAGYMTGTSYAAPKISGAAAVAFEVGASNREVVECMLERSAAYSDPDLGAGILNLDHILSGAALAECEVTPP